MGKLILNGIEYAGGPSIDDTNSSATKVYSSQKTQNLVSGTLGADVYDPTHTYATNDMCIYNNTLYKAKSSTTGNLPTDTTYWEPTTIKDLINTKQNSTDSSLTTTSDTIVGAINELNSGKADLLLLGGFKLQYRNVESNSTVYSPFFTEMCIAFCSRGANALGVASTAGANSLVSDSGVTFGLNTQGGYRMSVASNVGTHIKVCFLYY